MLRLPRWLSVLILLAGLGLLSTPFVSEAYTRYEQQKLLAELDDPVMLIPDEALVALAAPPPADTAPGRPSVSLEPELPPLLPPFRIEIPKLGLEAVVVDGVEEDDLRKGPGLYPHGVKPGEDGNVAIAAHRTTYGAWFRHVDQLVEGDQIVLSKGYRRIVYEVERVFPVASNDWSVIAPTDYNALTLTTCHPPGSAIQRLIVRARQVEDGNDDSLQGQ